MPRPIFENSTFDPSMCPLLAGLSPEEQAERMRTDPMIAACVRSVEETGSFTSQCAAPRPGRRRRQAAAPVVEEQA